MQRVIRKGFTLVEILVTTVVVAVLAAIVIPAVARQVTAGDPVRMVSDLNSVKTAIEVFGNGVRPKTPGDIEDLVNPLSTVLDAGLDGTSYTSGQAENWKGPYLNWSMIGGAQAGDTDAAFRTANGYKVYSRLRFCSGTTEGIVSTTCNVALGSIANPYVTVAMEGLTAAEFDRMNDIVDGAETVATSTGLLRYQASVASPTASSLTFFLASPYVAP